MYTLFVALGIGLGLFALVWLVFGSVVAGILPAVLAAGVAFFLLARRRGQQVSAEMAAVGPLIQAGQVAEAEQALAALKARHGKWQFLLEGQIDAQIGMLRYMELKFDAAKPLLVAGQFQNWTAQVLLGAIAVREGDLDEARKRFDDAAATQPKEAHVWWVPAVLLARKGDRDGALKHLAKGVEKLPDSEVVKSVRDRIANKKKIVESKLPQTWYQFWPEDLRKQYLVRGTRKGPPELPKGMKLPRQAPIPQPRMSKKARRG